MTLQYKVPDRMTPAARESAKAERLREINRIQRDLDALERKWPTYAPGEKLEMELEVQQKFLRRMELLLAQGPQPVLERPLYRKAFEKYLRGGLVSLDHELRSELMEGKALSEGSNVDGGFAVPTEFVPTVIQRRPGLTVLSDGATHLPVSRDQVSVPRIAANTGTYPTMYPNGISFAWVGENPVTTAGDTSLTWEQLPLSINVGRAKVRLSRWLVTDSGFDIMAFLGTAFANVAELVKEQAFLTGSGLGQPLGVTADPAVGTVTTAGVAVIGSDDLEEVVGALPEQYRRLSTIVLSNDCLKKVRELKDASGHYQFQQGDAAHTSTLCGLPYAVSDFLPAVASGNVPLFVGSLADFWIADRNVFSIDVIDQKYAESGQIEYLCWFRIAGAVGVGEAFKKLKVA